MAKFSGPDEFLSTIKTGMAKVDQAQSAAQAARATAGQRAQAIAEATQAAQSAAGAAGAAAQARIRSEVVGLEAEAAKAARGE